jgi:membrane fusion protein, adhesin transport system
MPKETYKSLSERDYEFMHSLSAAVLQKSPSKLRVIMYFWVVAFFIFVLWAKFALIDEIARGDGEIIPSGQKRSNPFKNKQ